MISAKTKIYGIFGYPIEHSLSPLMHNAAFKKLRLDYVYVAFPVLPEDLAASVKAIKALSLAGVNVTIPHKEKVIQLLDKITPEAQEIGAVNTIMNVNGILMGDNTDGRGFLRSLKQEEHVRLENKTVLVMGTGGVGRSLSVILLKDKVKKIYLYDLIQEKAEALAKTLDDKNRLIVIEKNNLKKIMPSVDILINASPVGMKQTDPCVILPELLHKRLFIYDVIYNQPTCLLKEARKRKIKCASGLGMLINQAALAFELWTGKSAPIEIMRKALT